MFSTTKVDSEFRTKTGWRVTDTASDGNQTFPMTLSDRLKEIDAKCVKAHRVLNAIAIAEVTDPSILTLRDDVRRAIADLTLARDMLNDLADESTDN